MKITSVAVFSMTVPLKTPFKTALRTVEEMRSVVVEVGTDTGAIGRGEAPATAVITGDTLGSIAWAIRRELGPRLLGRAVWETEALADTLQGAMAHNTSAKAALDMALYDLYGQLLEMPLWRLLGGYRQSVETDLTVSANDPETMVRDSLSAAQAGYRILKIKVGKDPGADVERILAIRRALPDIRLRIDANQGWRPKEAVAIIRRLEDAGADMELVEQPVAAEDVAGLGYVTRRVATPILADEAVFSVRDAAALIAARGADMINIKLMKTGGLRQAMTLCDLAQAWGVPCMMGCMLEGGIAATAAAHFAAARKNVQLADLDGPLLGKVDPVRGGADFTGPIIRLPETPGLGIQGVEGLIPIPEP